MRPRLFVYKLVYDGGAAPCVKEHLLTLAICKPRIRASAEVGDFVFGVAANSLSPDNRLIYIARVTEIEDNYYDDSSYRERPDCIYIRDADGRFSIRPDARFHEDGARLANDLGAFPIYPRARVLISDDYRYFSSSRSPPAVGLDRYPAVRALVRRLNQGHRVNHSAGVERELRRLQRTAWSETFNEAVATSSRSHDRTPTA